MEWLFFGKTVNILDIDPECFEINDFKRCKDGTTICNLCYFDKIGVPHIVFDNIDCCFKKSMKNSDFRFLIFFADGKNKNMIFNYGKIIKKIEDEIFSFIDEFEDEKFIFDCDFMSFKFKTDDNIVYNKIINIPVCVISVHSITEKKLNYYTNFKLQKCLYENESF